MEYEVGTKFISDENEYLVVRGKINSCRGCCFAFWQSNGDCNCCRPPDVGECLAENRTDGIDVIFHEI